MNCGIKVELKHSETIVKQLFQEINRDVINYSFLGKGEASIVYKVLTDKATYVLKTALYPERKNKVIKESEIRSSFINKGLDSIPSPIFTDDKIFSNGAVIYEYIEGFKPNFNDLNNVKEIARIISQIHQIDYKIVLDGFSMLKNLASSLELTTLRVVDRIPQLFNNKINAAFELGKNELFKKIQKYENFDFIGIIAKLHGDLSDNFLIDNNNKIWLIDWENSEYGDVLEEIFWFLSVNELSEEKRNIFYEEYKKNFLLSENIKFEKFNDIYSSANAIFNICWGIDQLEINIKQNLEPQRKIRDLRETCKSWKKCFSEEAVLLINEGIDFLSKKVNNLFYDNI
jgi:thiamine kinase-like enzyme